MKRMIALLLAVVMCCGMLAACANGGAGENTTKAPTPDDGVLRVLIIGHSLGNDSVWLLPEIAKNEGYTDLVVGMLYYSGCRLGQHIQFAVADAPNYEYRQFDLSKDTTWQIADANGAFWAGGHGADLSGKDIGQTMKFAIQAQDWDVVVLQAGVFEAAGNTSDCVLDTANIQTIMDYVLKNDVDKTTVPEFGWNMTWTCPSDLDLNKDTYRSHLLSAFANSQEMYESIASTLKDRIAAEYDFAYIMPTGTAFQNAHSSYMGDTLYRDYIHATDYARMIAAYTWLCTLTGADMSQMKILPIRSYHLKDTNMRNANINLTLTEVEKNILIESVSNALKNPYAMTQSVYTEKPAQ